MPLGWRRVQLEEIVDCFPGAWGADSAFENSMPVQVVGTSQISNEGLLNANDAPIRYLSQHETLALCFAGDLLVVKSSGSAANIRSGKTAICPNELSGKIACANFLMRLAPRSEVVEPYLLWHFLNGEDAKAFVRRIAGSSTYPNIKWSSFKNLEIPLPPRDDQRRIAGLLREQMAAVDKARAAAQARLEAVKALPAAFLRKVFPQPGQRLQPGWRWVKLGEVCEASGQYGTSKKSNGDQRGIPVLGMYHIHEGRIRWENISYVELDANELSKYLLRCGDVLFNRTNSAELVGKTAVYDLNAEAIFASYLIRFRLLEKIANPYFISAYINSRGGRAFIEKKMARAIGQVNISASTMQGMPIPVPDILEQQRIVGEYSEQMIITDRARQSIEAELDTISALPAALLRRAFSGEM